MLNKLKLRLRALFFKSKMEDELQAELQFHLEREIEENIVRGMTPEEARYAAIRSFGSVERVKEESRDVRGVRLLEEVWQDLRFGARMLMKNPGFTLIAVITLALGIGANTAIFSVTNALVLRPYDFHDLDRLVSVFGTMPQQGDDISLMAPADFADLRRQQTIFADLAAYRQSNSNLTGAGEPERVQNFEVSAGFFRLLGGEATLGRSFLPEEEQAGCGQVAVLSYSLW